MLEFRIHGARVTKDIDLRLTGAVENLHARLEEAGRLKLGDFMTFEVHPDANHPELRNEGMKQEGFRFRAECMIGDRPYGDVFGVDVAFGDPLLSEPDVTVTEDVLGFAGVAPARVRLYPVETHIAEKLHAYSLPRTRPNTRVKDLPDLALLALVGTLEATRVRAALVETFTYRGTHPLPDITPAPPETWGSAYAALAERDRLPWKTLDGVITVVRAFLDPVLAGGLDASWEPHTASWRARP
ncbi:nucleotidyl transferase AbiEii/AbiGii toxin family protein [Pyxidicoccus sp. 3LG]